MATKKKTKKSAKQKNRSWSEQELNVFASVLSSNDKRDRLWALTLETMALKKTANENVFEKIREEFKDSLAGEEGSDVYPFSIDQLRRKYKWLKNEWKTINDKHQNQSR